MDKLCSACGVIIGDVPQKPRWGNCPIAQVPWAKDYRLIYRLEEGSAFLSGSSSWLGLSVQGQRFPWNRHMSWIRGRKGDLYKIIPSEHWSVLDELKTLQLVDCMTPELWDTYPYGFLLHDNCWKLIERVIGYRAGDNLELFLQVLCDRWKEKNAFVVTRFVNKDTDITWRMPSPPPEIEITDPKAKNACQHKDVYEPHLDDPDRLCNRTWSVSRIPLRDPWNIPQVRYHIRRCMENGARRATKQKTRKWRVDVAPWPTRDAAPFNLPLDIKFLLLDVLGGVDVQNALIAFGWIIPDAYWKSRLPRDIVFELDDVDKAAAMDWKSLCLKLEGMVQTLPELQNRQRILRILRRTKALFFERGGWSQ